MAKPETSALTSAPSEVAFRLLVDAVVDYAIFLLDPDGRVSTWNRGAKRIYGLSASEIIGQPFVRFYTEEDRAAGKPQALLDAARRDGRVEDEGWRVKKDGSLFWADALVTALRDEDGTLVGFSKVTRDSTERRAAERRERELAIEQQARVAAEEALRARDHFLSIASHELKTPVASLQLATEGLLRSMEIGTLSGERLSLGLERMRGATERLGLLVNELLDVSRLTSGTTPIAFATTDLAELTRDVLDGLEDLPGADRITLDAPAPVRIQADRVRLEQVLMNLIDNAMKYSGDAARIDVRVRSVPDGAIVEVRDEGVGIEAVARRRLFEPFGRGRSTSHIPGMGLGLFISRQIIERHGGTIRVESDGQGHGATFTVWLPGGPDGR